MSSGEASSNKVELDKCIDNLNKIMALIKEFEGPVTEAKKYNEAVAYAAASQIGVAVTSIASIYYEKIFTELRKEGVVTK